MNTVIAETIDILIEKSPTPLKEIWIDDLVIGLFFTGVKLSTGHAGVAFTPIGEIPEAVCCPTTAARMPQAGELEGTPISEIIKYSLDPNVVKSAIGVATLNGLSQLILETANGNEYEMDRNRDGFNLLSIQPHEAVSLIGRVPKKGETVRLEGPNAELYRLLQHVLSELDQGRVPAAVLSILFQMRFLRLSGHSPNLARCVGCQCEMPAMRPGELGVDIAKGGIACPACAPACDHAQHLSKGTVKQLLWVSAGDLSRAARMKFSPQAIAESLAFLERFVPHHLGRQPRSLKILRQLRGDDM